MPSCPYPKLELKYCERCGGLWLRPQGGDAVYCASCARAIHELPPVAPRGGTPPGAMHAAGLALLPFLTTLPGLAGTVGSAGA